MARRFLLLPLVFLAFSIFLAGRYGIASMYAMQPGEVLEELSSRNVKPSVVERQQAWIRLEKAMRLDPQNPFYLENLARLCIVEADLTRGRQDELLREGLAAIRKAIKMRPVSAYSWASLLILKSRLGEFDSEFDRALSHAVFLGPWEPEVQLEVARVGIANWERLDFRQREEIRKDIARAMKRHSEEIIQIVMAGKRAGR